jgi:hypothetical protein
MYNTEGGYFDKSSFSGSVEAGYWSMSFGEKTWKWEQEKKI